MVLQPGQAACVTRLLMRGGVEGWMDGRKEGKYKGCEVHTATVHVAELSRRFHVHEPIQRAKVSALICRFPTSTKPESRAGADLRRSTPHTPPLVSKEQLELLNNAAPITKPLKLLSCPRNMWLTAPDAAFPFSHSVSGQRGR